MEKEQINIIGVTDEAIKLLQENSAIVTSIRSNYVYSDGERTDKTDGFTLTAITLNGKLAGTEFRLKTALDPNVNVGSKININIEDSTVYAKTNVNSRYANIEFSLSGTVTPLIETKK